MSKIIPKSFEELVERLHGMFDSDKVDIDDVKELMCSYQSKPSDWEKYAQFDQYK